MKTLILIVARAGSKGLPGKNTKLLGGKSLFSYTLDFAKQIKKASDVLCISTDDDEVIAIANDAGIIVPFKRPAHLATDQSGVYEVMLHAVDFYKNNGFTFDNLLLLQPTSPFRKIEDFRSLQSVFAEDCEMAATVKISKENPYFNLFEESPDGYIKKSKVGNFHTRQACPIVYAYNGSMYLMKISALESSNLHNFTKIRKSVMPDVRSIDIDTISDWLLAENYLNTYINEGC